MSVSSARRRAVASSDQREPDAESPDNGEGGETSGLVGGHPAPVKASLELEVAGRDVSRPQFTRWVLLAYAAMALIYAAGPTVLLLCVCQLLWKGEVNAGAVIFTMATILATMIAPPCMAYNGAKSSDRLMQLARKHVCMVLMCQVVGFMICGAIVKFFYGYDPGQPLVRDDFDESLPVAVVGSGASGLTAAWMLAMGGRKVQLFEALDDIAGHSKSYVEARGDGKGGNLTIDLGYIFNNPLYGQYKALTDYAGFERRDSALNTSGAFGGKYWDNTGSRRFSEEMEAEMERFMSFVREEPIFLRNLVPFGVWAWRHGFSRDFMKLCIDSTMSVLFVTKMGLKKQPTQAVLNHFRGSGFTHMKFDPSSEWGRNKVQITVGGSQNVWRRVQREILETGRGQVHLKKKLVSAGKEDGLWALTFEDGSKVGGFADLILALPANVASAVVRGAGLRSAVVGQLDYMGSEVTLHTDHASVIANEFSQAPPSVLYFVTETHMSGKIGQIFGNPQSDLLLTVSGQGQKPVKIAPEKIKWRTYWSHHYFSLWELIIAMKVLPTFQGVGGLHYAGDWVYGVGHNDAMRSGVSAACRAGLRRETKVASASHFYRQLLDHCK